MSRSTFYKTNESSSSNPIRFHSNPVSTPTTNTRINESMIGSSAQKSIVRMNPKMKRNLRDKRRATGIRADEVSLASTPTDGSDDDNEDEKQSTVSSPPPAPTFTVSRVQSSMEKLSLNRSDPHPKTSPAPNKFRTEEFILRRQPSDDDSTSTIKQRQLEERLLTLESLVYEKDSIINDLQRKLEQTKRELADAEQQIYTLHKDKLTLIKAFSSSQDNKPPANDLSKRPGLITRN